MITKTNLILISIAILFLLSNIFTCNKMKNMNNKFDNYEKTIYALNDSITKTVKDGVVVYSKLTPEININDLTNSEYFKTLAKEQQEYFNELKKIKGLISSTKAELEKHGQMLDEINKKNNPGIVNNDSISFKLGTELTFNENDTTKHMQWHAKILLDTNIKFNLDYKYKFDIQTTFERNKDKTITVNYKINDPDLQVKEMYNFIIPTEQKTKFQTFMDKNKKPIKIAVGSLIFIGGVYVGNNVLN